MPTGSTVSACLLEPIDRHRVDIIWGSSGETSAALRVEDVRAAAEEGHLILLE